MKEKEDSRMLRHDIYLSIYQSINYLSHGL